MRDVRTYSFEGAKSAWARPPIDDIGYISSSDMLKDTDDNILAMVSRFLDVRYGLSGWRNYRNLWRICLGLDNTTGKTILDFGCGYGIESLEFAKANNDIILTDIVQENVDVSARILQLHGHAPVQTILSKGVYPFFEPDRPVDVFYANGVLHHTPDMREILLRACEVLPDEGEIRVMLYSGRGWEAATNAPAVGVAPAREHPSFRRFVAYFDGVGDYADWYNFRKLRAVVGDFLEITDFSYMTKKHNTLDMYCAATLKPRSC